LFPEDPAPAGEQFVRLLITQRLCPDGAELAVRVTGEVDIVTATTLAEGFERARLDLRVLQDGLGIVADLRGVRFLSAAGLGVLVHARDECLDDGFGFRVVAENAAVVSPLTMTGLDRLLDLRPGPPC
jgi:anti-anti-sigma factor